MMNGRDRPRGPPPSDMPTHREPRRGADGRNGGLAGPGDGSMSRAEKFEDEKRRIMQSCFSKKDTDGTCMWLLPIQNARICPWGRGPSARVLFGLYRRFEPHPKTSEFPQFSYK
ncbi:hypothetical protein AWENTII_001598 [Aspergillus wentii]